MPKTNDNAAAKAKKQKMILIAGAVLLAAVAAFQGPKILKGGGSAAPPPAAAASASDGSAVSAAATPSASTPVAAVAQTSTGKTLAVVAGVPLKAGPSARPASNQLVSFTLFEAKDPFVQQEDGTDAASAPEGAPTGQTGPTGSTGPAASPAPSASQGTPPAAAKPAPIVYATIDFNGKPQQLQVKGEFPIDDPLFVLRSLTKKQAKIAVAGGSFDDGSTITLKLNKKVTLVNTATGVRYELKLVYTGATPEVIESFTTTGSGDGTTGSGNAAPTPTTGTSTDGATTGTAG